MLLACVRDGYQVEATLAPETRGSQRPEVFAFMLGFATIFGTRVPLGSKGKSSHCLCRSEKPMAEMPPLVAAPSANIMVKSIVCKVDLFLAMARHNN